MELLKKIEYKFPKISEIIRFLLIGGIATIIDLMVMALVIYSSNKSGFGSFLSVFANKHIASGWIVTIASAIGFITGLVFNYVFSLIFVYKGDNAEVKTKKGFITFTYLSLIGLIIETLGVFIGYSLFHINEWIVKVFFICIVLVFNYITRKKFLFKDSLPCKKDTVNESCVEFTDKDKKILTFVSFSFLFILYTLVSVLFVYYINSLSHDFMFNCDSPRVLLDFTDMYADHYRTKVHPLYVLFVYPLTSILMFLGLNNIMAVIIIMTLISTINAYLVYKIATKFLKNNQILAILITIFYALSFTVLENLMIVESFIFSLFTILLFWCFFIYNFNKLKLNFKNIVILILLGTLCFSMLLTNFAHFLLGLFFLIVINKKKKFKEYVYDCFKYAGIVIASIAISSILIEIQSFLFPRTQSAIEYIKTMILDMFRENKQAEEFSYINFSINGTSFLNILIYFFGIAFTGGIIKKEWFLFVVPNAITTIMIIIMFILAIYSLFNIIRYKKYIALPIILIYGFEMVLHLFYGNNELMLYINQSSFLLLTIIAIGLSCVDKKYNKISNISAVSIIFLSIIQVIISCISILLHLYREFGLTQNSIIRGNYRFILIFVLTIMLYYTILFLVKRFNSREILVNKNINKKDKWLGITSMVIVSIITATIITSTFVPKNPVINNYNTTINNPPIQTNSVFNPDRVLMGMGQRKKYVLENTDNGYIFYNYNVSNKEKTIILEKLGNVQFDPLNYTIKCKDEVGKDVTILENEIGIYLYKDKNIQILDESEYINIPNFENYTYSNYLKITFYETMVNVLPNGFTPNYLTYGNFWYRDGAMMAMVLEATDNLSQLRIDVGVDDIYDGARGGVDEPDNLGELLYMLSLQEEINWPVVNAVLEEAERIKQSDNCIHGLTDFSELYVYQTKWLKYGMEKLGLDSSAYNVDGKQDGYSTMCWWYDRGDPEDYPYNISQMESELWDTNKTYYPYLQLAELHYYEVKLNIPNDLNYPISFEWKDCAPHSWTASELFLYLLDYDNF